MATPQAAPGEALNNGATRTVGQVSVAFSDANLISKSPVNLYVKSTDLISTDGKDAKSAVSVIGGIQRGLFSKWYSPTHLEQSLQGNQTAKNLSTVTSLKFRHSTSVALDETILSNNHFFYSRSTSARGLYSQSVHTQIQSTSYQENCFIVCERLLAKSSLFMVDHKLSLHV